MKNLDRMKQRMIRQLVAENLSTEGSVATVGDGDRAAWTVRRLLGVSFPLLAAAVLGVAISTAMPQASSPTGSSAQAGGGRAASFSGSRQRTTSLRQREEPSGPWSMFSSVAPEDVPTVMPAWTVILDPGHGGRNNPGTVSANGAMEKDLALDISRRLANLLEEAGFRVMLTRADDREVSLKERTRLANEAAADLFVSVHVNWLDGSLRGFETFFLGPTDDPEVAGLMSHENYESGYSLATLREILQGVYANLRQDESRRLAQAVHSELRWHIGQVAPEIVDRGVKTAPFIVLIGTEMPAILAEVSALSNDEDARLLELPSYRQYLALALFGGIRSYAQTLHEPNDQSS